MGDDRNNVCRCGWDGGDCCGPNKGHKYCVNCSCKDPRVNCDGSCAVYTFKGDGNCDDNNNNCGCGWDGGDCCGHDNTYDYCSDCSCRDPFFKGNHTCIPKCEVEAWKGDGNCDDRNNKCGCDWDGGDCCAKTNKKLTPTSFRYCNKCACLDEAEAKCSKPCKVISWVGNKICDDENNHCGCNWDGGDCCGNKNDYRYCHKCSCLDETFVHADAKCKKNCGVHQWKGDGKCDDANNVCGCDWDGGDCCGHAKGSDQHQYGYCKKCRCRDPSSVSK